MLRICGAPCVRVARPIARRVLRGPWYHPLRVSGLRFVSDRYSRGKHMAQVAHSTKLQPDVDYHLDYQFQAWESVPEYAAWWPDMDGTQREAFHLEWVGITESRLTA